MNELEGKHHDNYSDHHLIDKEWIITTELVRKLNDYFVTEGGERYETKRPPITKTALQTVSIGHVKRLLYRIDTTKSNNSEDFPSWISEAAAENLSIPVTNIINTMLDSNTYPSVWKKAEIRPLMNVKNPSQLSQ